MGDPYEDTLQLLPSLFLPLRWRKRRSECIVSPEVRMTGHRVWLWWMDLIASPFRRIMQDPTPIVTPYARAGMTVLEPGPGMGFLRWNSKTQSCTLPAIFPSGVNVSLLLTVTHTCG